MFKETGRIVFLSGIRTGISSRSQEEWAMMDVVIETLEMYPRKIMGTIRKRESIDNAGLKYGEILDVFFEPRAHEYNGSWFNDLTIVDIQQNGYSRFIRQIIPGNDTQKKKK